MSGNNYGTHGINCNCEDEVPKTREYVLIDKQLLKQKLNEEYTADMLGRALSKAEYLSSRFGKFNLEKQFDYYNRFDNGIMKDGTQLVKSFINAIDTLQDYYEMDKDKKKFPSNWNQTKIIKYIEVLRDNLDKNQTIIFNIFNDFIHIIKGDKSINFDNYFNNEKASANPKILATSGIKAMRAAANQEKEWKNKFMEKGNYPVELKTGQKWTNNQNFYDLMNLDDVED